MNHKSGLGSVPASILDGSDRPWRSFLRRNPIEPDLSSWEESHADSTILIAGAGGSIGSHLTRRLAAAAPRLLILVDNSEHALYRIHAELAAAPSRVATAAVLADVCDEAALDDLFARHRPNLVYHAAAFKHVPLVEANPLAGLRNNALGTWVLAKTAARHHAAALLALSTDKAADPRSVLGLSKRVAELVLLGLGNSRTRMNSLRLGNVLGSRGSVVPLFLQQIARGGPVTVTHPDVRRYFLTLDEAVGLILAASAYPEGGKLLAPELGEPIRVADLAEFLIRGAGFTPREDVAIAFTGLRPGDKMSEELISTREARAGAVNPWLFLLETPGPAPAELARRLDELQAAAERWDTAAGIAAARFLAPEYDPGAELLQALGVADANAKVRT